MNRESKILIAGSDSFAGMALARHLKTRGGSFVSLSSAACLESELVAAFFEDVKPEYVFLTAGRSGGIAANGKYPAEFMRENLIPPALIMEAARKFGTQKLIYCASSCVYPKNAPQPMKPEDLFQSPLESTSQPYALAKLSGIELCGAYQRQYGSRFIAVIPSDPFGPDSFHGEDSHVVASLLMKMHEAKLKSLPSVTLWGSGNPVRDFIYSEDLAAGLSFVMESYEERLPVNLSAGCPLSIAELAEKIRIVTGFRGAVEWDSARPDGAPAKILDVSVLKRMGWKSQTEFMEALRRTYEALIQTPEGAHV